MEGAMAVQAAEKSTGTRIFCIVVRCSGFAFVRSGPKEPEHMTTIQNILFPVDFSASCTAMAPYIKRAAAIASAKVTLLYVLEPSPSAAAGFELLARPLREVEEDRESVARAKLDSYLPSEFPLDHSPRLFLAGEAGVRIA